MLDVSYNAKLGDFGLARLVEHGEEPRTTQVIAGTPGYVDPEFIAIHCSLRTNTHRSGCLQLVNLCE